jgi:hypothetical protein
MRDARAFPGFIGVSGYQELDPVLDAVFGEDEYDPFELLLGNPLFLGVDPAAFLQGFGTGTIMVAVRPHH